MTVPANLFIEAPEVQDMTLTKLDGDVNSWPEEIITKLKERVPNVEGSQTMVKIMKKDEENGTATGSIVINTASSSVVVPVIIKEFMLYPLDVMISKKKILPLTPDYLDAVLSNNDVFLKIEEYPTYGGLGRFEDANLWNAVYPPSLGRYAYASAGYPMLDLISDELDGTPLKDWIKDNPEYAVGFHKHGHTDLIRKVANLKPVNMNEFRQGAEKLIPKNIKMLAFDGPNKYSILSSSDKVFSPAIDKTDRLGAIHFLSEVSDHAEDDINDVDQNGEKLLMLPEGGEGVFLAKTDGQSEIAEEAREFDHYYVRNKNGVGLEGVVVPHVVDFNQDKVDVKLFLGKGFSTVQNNIWGMRIKNSRFKPEYSQPRVGQSGTFVYQPDQSHAVATIPVTIRSVHDDCGSLKIKAMDLTGKPYHLAIASKMGLKRIATLPTGEYLVPKEMKWTVMEGFGEVSNSAISYAVKTAGARLTTNPVKLSPNGFGAYTLRGVDKYASAMGVDATNLSKVNAKFMLACLGCPQEKIAQAFKVAQMRGVAELHGLATPPLKDEKIAQARPKAAAAVKIASLLRRDLIKEASYIDNSQTVDALLSLNFVSPTNIGKFVGKIPHFKGTISNLASALLASRLGMTDIPEEACSVAMSKLVEVVDGLERLRASQDVTQK